MGWDESGHTKWTHGQLWVTQKETVSNCACRYVASGDADFRLNLLVLGRVRDHYAETDQQRRHRFTLQADTSEEMGLRQVVNVSYVGYCLCPSSVRVWFLCWSPHFKSEIDRIESVQRRFTKRLRSLNKFDMSYS